MGRLKAEDMMQWVEKVPNAYAIAAKAMGIEVEKLRQLIAEGKIEEFEVLPALQAELSGVEERVEIPASPKHYQAGQRIMEGVLSRDLAIGDTVAWIKTTSA